MNATLQYKTFIIPEHMRNLFANQTNLGLTLSEFELLRQQLIEGNELLFEKMFCGFFKKSLTILKGKYQAAHEDAYDSVLWAMLRMRQLLLENKVAHGNIENYFNRIAITHYLKSQTRKKEYATENLPEPVPDLQEERFDEETLAILEEAWAQLGGPCQKLLKGFYYDKTELKKLTVLLGDSSEANTRKRKERCIKQLKELFFQSY